MITYEEGLKLCRHAWQQFGYSEDNPWYPWREAKASFERVWRGIEHDSRAAWGRPAGERDKEARAHFADRYGPCHAQMIENTLRETITALRRPRVVGPLGEEERS